MALRFAASLFPLMLVSLAWSQATSPLNATQRAYLETRAPLRVCVDPAWMPLEALDSQGRHVGIGADLLEAMAKRGGVRYQIIATRDWSESLARSQARECDLLPMLSDTPERRAWLDFTSVYLRVPNVIVTDLEVPYVQDLHQIGAQRVAVLRGVSGVLQLRREFPQLTLVEVASYREGFNKVLAGEVFGVVGNLASISLALQQGQNRLLKIAGETGFSTDSSIGTRNDEPMLASVFETLVQDLHPKTVQAVMNRWVPVRYQHEYDRAAVWRLLPWVLVGAAVLLAWLYKLRQLNRRLAIANHRLQAISRVDALTGLLNRLPLAELLQSAMHRGIAESRPLALVMIDIDEFKSINDRFGHLGGDVALRHIAEQLRRAFPEQDASLMRYGGEEFLVLLNQVDADALAARLEQLRIGVAGNAVSYAGQAMPFSISVGWWCGLPLPGMAPDQLLAAADAALYQAKEAGRNRIVRAALAGAND